MSRLGEIERKAVNFNSPEQVFEWWISNENAADWLNKQHNQLNLFL